MDAFIGEIRPFGFNFNPRGWLICDGSLLSIREYTALFSVIGNQYGGDGRINFALPDLRGRVPMGTGVRHPVPGEAMGAAEVTLMANNLPPHSHTLYGRGADVSVPAPSAASQLSGTSSYDSLYAPDPMTVDALAPQTLGAVGMSRPKPNRQPFQAVNFCICHEGDYPPHP